VYLCENDSVSSYEIENNLHDLWNEACNRNRFGWSKRGVGVNVMEGENGGIYGLKKELTFEGFENVKKILIESKKRTKRKFKEKILILKDLERNIFFLFNGLKLKFFDEKIE
jgi:hypothetical protein